MYGQTEDRWSRVPQRDISTGTVTFRTMIRQAAVAFAQALSCSVQETLHSGLLLSVWSCIPLCTSIFGWLWKQQQCWVVASSCELRAPRPTLARLLQQCCVKSFFSQTSIWKRSCRLRKLCVAAETAHGRVAFASSGAASSTWMRGIPHLQPACQPLANLLESRASTIADEDGDENACSRTF